jgi:ArsR family metal-binding transcriptional regulator
MLIENYELEVFTPPCDPGAERYVARARLTTDISCVLPYLNAVEKAAEYLPEANALTWKEEGHLIALHPFEIAVSNFEDRAEAEKKIGRIADRVNRTWENRAEIQPDTTGRKRFAPMALYKLLPQTNCRECGAATCFSFALQLAANQKPITDCPPLLDSKYAAAREQLQRMFAEENTRR